MCHSICCDHTFGGLLSPPPWKTKYPSHSHISVECMTTIWECLILSLTQALSYCTYNDGYMFVLISYSFMIQGKQQIHGLKDRVIRWKVLHLWHSFCNLTIKQLVFMIPLVQLSYGIGFAAHHPHFMQTFSIIVCAYKLVFNQEISNWADRNIYSEVSCGMFV